MGQLVVIIRTVGTEEKNTHHHSPFLRVSEENVGMDSGCHMCWFGVLVVLFAPSQGLCVRFFVWRKILDPCNGCGLAVGNAINTIG